MFKLRLISFPLCLALLAVLFFWPPYGQWLFVALVPVIGVLLALELCRMLQTLRVPTAPLLTAGVTAVVWLAGTPHLFWGEKGWNELYFAIRVAVIALLPALVLLAWLLVLLRRPGLFAGILVSAGVVFLLSASFLPLASLYPYQYGGGRVSLLFFVIAVSKSMDTGGYIAGMLSARLLPGGNHKIAPSISPKKSWEGFFGGLLLAVGVALLLCQLCQPASWWQAAVFGVVLGIGSFFGDLTESALKRAAGIKDSGSWIPGMGGAFDVADSLIYNGILTYFLLLIF